ncbi:MAG TPA: peptidoglycan-associated lipoprotein Pal [Myxococcales bacterium]
MRRLAPLALALLFGCPKPPAYPECRNDDDCSGRAEVCINGVCRECRDDAQCAKKPGTACVNNACQPKAQCQQNQDCPQAQKCAQNKCVPECTEATAQQDCGAGKKCLSGRCAAPDACNVDADCGSGQACVQNRCAAAQASCRLDTVYFGFDDSSLTPEARSTLDSDYQCLRQRGNPPATIAGHTDERGTTEYNLALGQRRAESVRKYLAGLGADASKMKVVSHGEERPADPGHDETAWAKNRRAEITAGAGQ